MKINIFGILIDRYLSIYYLNFDQFYHPGESIARVTVATAKEERRENKALLYCTATSFRLAFFSLAFLPLLLVQDGTHFFSFQTKWPETDMKDY